MASLTEQIAGFVLRNQPDAYCFGCISSRLKLTDHEVRDGAQGLVGEQGFRLVSRPCYACRVVGPVVEFAHDAGPGPWKRHSGPPAVDQSSER